MGDKDSGTESARARLVRSMLLGALEGLAEASKRPPPPRMLAATDVALGLGAVAVDASRRVSDGVAGAVRPLTEVLSPPVAVRRSLRPGRWVRGLAARGQVEREAAAVRLEALGRRVAPQLLDAALGLVDLTDIVRDHVDIDALVATVDVDAVVERVDIDAILERVDVDAIAARLDVDAVVARLDLIALAEFVVEGVDLPEIIRGSTGTMTSEAVRGVRTQGIDADDRVARVVDRMLRRQERRAGGPAEVIGEVGGAEAAAGPVIGEDDPGPAPPDGVAR
jgi:hypothetical protein